MDKLGSDGKHRVTKGDRHPQRAASTSLCVVQLFADFLEADKIGFFEKIFLLVDLLESGVDDFVCEDLLPSPDMLQDPVGADTWHALIVDQDKLPLGPERGVN